MVRWILVQSLRLAVTVVVAAGVLVGVGVAGLRHAAVDTLPEFQPTRVEVQTSALGLSASEVEQLITVPLEDEFNGVPFMSRMTSRSIPNLSTITLTFAPGTNLYTARQLVTERVAQGPAMANVGQPPVMIQPLSSEGRVMMIGLSSRSMSLVDLSTLARWRIRPRLLAVPGVANVAIWGQRDKQLQVLADPARMSARGVTLDQVVSTAGDAMWTSPLSFVEASSPGSDGFLDTPNQRVQVQHQLSIRTPADLAAVPVEDVAGPAVTLGDVATVVESFPPLAGDAQLPGGSGFMIVVEKSPGANTLEVARNVDAAMAELAPSLGGVTVDTSVFRPADYLRAALDNVGLAGLIGLVLLILWLGLAFRSWRAAVIGLVAVPVALVGAAYVLYLRGTTFTAMTLAGVMLALAVVVDDVVRGTAAVRGVGRDSAAAVEATRAARRPLGFALAIIVVAALPLYGLTGVGQKLAAPLADSYLLAVAASTVVALTVTPALAHLLPVPAREYGAARRLAAAVGRGAGRAVERPLLAFGALAVLAAVALTMIPRFGSTSLIPAFQDRDLVVQWSAQPGTSLTEMDRVTQRAAAALRALPGVASASSDVGQALLGDQTVDVDSAQTWIGLAPGADYGSAIAAVQQTLSGFPGLGHTLRTYESTSLDAAGTGNGKAVTVRLYGSDQGVLAAQAASIRRSLAAVPGVAGTEVGSAPSAPAVQIATDTAAAARAGLSPGAVRRDTAVLLAGIPVGSYYQQDEIFDVTVWSEPADRQSLTAVQNLPLDTPSGGRVPLKDVAGVSVGLAPTEIDRDQASRYVDVTADVHGADLGTVLGAVDAHVLPRTLPLGYHATVFSDVQQQQNDDLKLLLYALAGCAAILLLLQAACQSWTRTAILLTWLGPAVAGGAITALIAGWHVTIGTLLGFMAVFVLAVRAGVVLVRRIQRLERDTPDAPRAGLAVRAASEAAAPTVTTAVGLALALLPFALPGTFAGAEILRPFGLVVLGGLATLVPFTLLVLPSLYVRVLR